MTILTPKATRFVALAMRHASEHDRAIWEAVDRDTSKELPPVAINAAVHALTAYARQLRAQLDAPGLSDDETADLSNDLRFVSSLEQGLRAPRRELVAA